jgi:transcriptional regulator with XRE-family HTH domain
MSAITDTIRLPDELGLQLLARRKALGMSKSELAQRAGKVREVIYRLEAGEDTAVSSLLAVLAGLGLALRLEPVGLPSAEDVARRFQMDDDEDTGDASRAP